MKFCYRPQTKFLGQGNIFAPVCHSVHGGGLPQCMLGYHPPPRQPPPTPPPREQTPPGPGNPLGASTPLVQCMLGDTVNKRAVCILLECNLVLQIYLLQTGVFCLNFTAECSIGQISISSHINTKYFTTQSKFSYHLDSATTTTSTKSQITL